MPLSKNYDAADDGDDNDDDDDDDDDGDDNDAALDQALDEQFEDLEECKP